MEERLEGRIVKATGGFYYVETAGGRIECRARGLFRKEGITPYVGDLVQVEPTQPGKGYVVEIRPRKNSLIRPPLANIDRLVMVVSTTQPEPNALVLDTMLAIACRREIQPLIVLTKKDLVSREDLREIYGKAGFEVLEVSSETGEGIEEVRARFEGGLIALSGNSGAGKSSLLNALFPQLQLPTAAISDKLGRGRHTTRHVELYPLPGGGYVADTPGFSAVELEQYELMTKDQLQYCFPEFEPYLLQCRFTGCSHTKEKGCAVLEAVERGEISPSRHQSYQTLYDQLKEIKEWDPRFAQERKARGEKEAKG